ncbi:MAG: shikimate kinase [Chitinophagaceae bacterium]
MKIFLIGFMGSGKSYWARHLAESLQLPLSDMDEEIERKTGLSISDIFSQKGELYFRTFEHELLKELIQKGQLLLSCGGGLPCFNDNMSLMNQNGLTIWLNTPLKVMSERLKRKKYKRPLLKGLSDEQLVEFVTNKLAERTAFYNRAKLIVNPLDYSVESLTQKIMSCKELI